MVLQRGQLLVMNQRLPSKEKSEVDSANASWDADTGEKEQRFIYHSRTEAEPQF